MHMEQMFVLLKYGTTPSLRRVVEEVVDKQLLIANANSEVGIGGDVMRSNAALEPDGDGWRFDKQALAASYGLDADMILSTARRSPDAAERSGALPSPYSGLHPRADERLGHAQVTRHLQFGPAHHRPCDG